MPHPAPFAALARSPDARLDELALALAAEFRAVDAAAALAALDGLGASLAEQVAAAGDGPEAEVEACAALLGRRCGFAGDTEHYDDPRNSMLDVVLERRRGLPILLSVVYVEVARRAGVPLAGVGLPGHFVVGHFGAAPALLLDPFAGGAPVHGAQPQALLRRWRPHEIVMRMLNNLVGSYLRRGDIGAAIRAATMRLELPAEESLRESLETELRTMQARLN
jgi:regulator of sirC expression with transglutaminase-like and TPR domain